MRDSFIKRIWLLFITFLKIGTFTFGGGYAMIPIINKEVIDKKHWMNEGDLLNIIAIGESTPGPIAVNIATYVGYRIAGILGGIIATLALAIPSIIIIIAISYFYQAFISSLPMQAIFKGLRVGVVILLFMAILKLKKSFKFGIISTILFIICLSTLLLFNIFQIQFNYLSILFILIGLITGIILESITSIKRGKK